MLVMLCEIIRNNQTQVLRTSQRVIVGITILTHAPFTEIE